ncbi:hypothetical protein [Agrobacterium tumefaciens]|uniref:hypothetical protein n=1 Tax=Agrobacterium tumefaciens TaxID=358 RepID=UPI001FAA2B74|nr:hypothetical protein [Agrobacterium tumefaciens]UNZ49321.1 hypothetical protein MLE07_07940 [Agrobacterium tumefaciens]
MTNDLRDHFARLDWAAVEIGTLEAEIAEFLSSHPIEIRFHYDLGTGNRVYKAYQAKDPPKGIQIRTGTIINELRSTLDALAVTLAARNGATKFDDTYFPMGKTKDIFAEKRVRDRMKRLSDSDQAIITNLQPYQGGNDLLYTLHLADIIRKHQRLVLSAAQTNQLLMGKGDWILDGGRVVLITNPGGPIGRGLFIAELSHDYHIDFEITGEIAFSEPPFIKGNPVLETLRQFLALVHSILKLFERAP